MKKFKIIMRIAFISLLMVLNLAPFSTRNPALASDLHQGNGSPSIKDPLFLSSVGEGPLMAIPICGVGTWQKELSSPTPLDLMDVLMISPTDGWAVGINGVILRYTGGTWQQVASPNNNDLLQSVSMASPTSGWAVGYDNSTNVVIFNYNGSNWNKLILSPLIPGRLRRVVMTSPSTGWAVGSTGAQGLVMRYSGGQWSVSSNPGSPLSSLARVPNAQEEELWAGGANATLFHYKGGSWQTVAIPVSPNQSIVSLAFLSPTDGWAGTSAGILYHYDGVSWRVGTGQYAASSNGLNLLSTTNGWTFSQGAFAHYDGLSWRWTQQIAGTTPFSLSMSSETDGWAVGTSGTIWRYHSESGLSRCIYGRVTTDKGQPTAGVAVADGQGHTAVTGIDGYYTFNGLPAGIYTLTPSGGGYLFYPQNRTVNLVTYAAGQDFAALLDWEDSDGDGLPNAWEVLGYDSNGDGIIDVDLPALGANPLHKDIFVEADYMVSYVPVSSGAIVGKSFKPRKLAMDKVIAAFANAPVTNPDGRLGITLHVEVDEAIPNQAVLTPTGQPWSWTGFNQIKNGRGHFSPAKRRVYHYVLFVQDLGGDINLWYQRHFARHWRFRFRGQSGGLGWRHRHFPTTGRYIHA